MRRAGVRDNNGVADAGERCFEVGVLLGQFEFDPATLGDIFNAK